MNLSIQKGIYPSKLKHAKMVPVYKMMVNLILETKDLFLSSLTLT